MKKTHFFATLAEKEKQYYTKCYTQSMFYIAVSVTIASTRGTSLKPIFTQWVFF